MKQIRRLTALLLAVMLLSTMFGAAALAAKKTKYIPKDSRPVLDIIPGTDIAIQENWHSTDPIYKLTVSQDALVRWTWSGNDAGDAYLDIYLDPDMKKNSHWDIYLNTAAGTGECAVPAGSYYLYMRDLSHATHICFTAAPLTEFKNYTASRAKKLKANVPITVAMTRMTVHPVWYKIKLTKKQRITVTSDSDDYSVALYDSRGRRLRDVAGSSKSVATAKKVAKGTYYIRVEPYSYYKKFLVPITFSWR